MEIKLKPVCGCGHILDILNCEEILIDVPMVKKEFCLQRKEYRFNPATCPSCNEYITSVEYPIFNNK